MAGFFSKKEHYSYQLTFDTALPDEEPLTQPRWRLIAITIGTASRKGNTLS